LTLGNWDPAGTGKGAVSWGVAPNIDKITFYPVTIGEVVNTDAEPDPNPEPGPVLESLEAKAASDHIALGGELKLTVTAHYNDGTSKTLEPGQYQVTGFDANKAGEQTVTITYTEGDQTATARITITVDKNANGDNNDGDNDNDGDGKPQNGNTGNGNNNTGNTGLSRTGAGVTATAILATAIALAGITLTHIRRKHA
uniref:bacterial Ig-like domain-containing protein n=1 Tax=Bifidobacterium aesculapii TaxID=1329411 RepID=UPI000A91E5F8